VAGRPVRVLLGDEPPAPAGAAAASAKAQPVEADLLEKARKNPAVQSFLDAFPGPVNVEKGKP